MPMSTIQPIPSNGPLVVLRFEGLTMVRAACTECKAVSMDVNQNDDEGLAEIMAWGAEHECVIVDAP